MRYPILLLVLILSAGCATSGTAQLTNDNVVSQIKVGTSTKEDVRRLLGEPSSVGTSNVEGRVQEIWGYGYASVKSNPLAFVPIVGLFAVASGDAAKMDSRALSVSFSEDGIVRSVFRYKSSSPSTGQPSPEEQR